MNELIKDILIFLSVIVIHEIGHFIMFLIYTKKIAGIKFRWWGILIGEKESLELTPIQYYWVAFAGVVSGFLPLSFFNADFILIAAYLAACIIDFITIFYLLILKKEYLKLKNMREVYILRAKDIIKELKVEK